MLNSRILMFIEKIINLFVNVMEWASIPLSIGKQYLLVHQIHGLDCEEYGRNLIYKEVQSVVGSSEKLREEIVFRKRSWAEELNCDKGVP